MGYEYKLEESIEADCAWIITKPNGERIEFESSEEAIYYIKDYLKIVDRGENITTEQLASIASKFDEVSHGELRKYQHPQHPFVSAPNTNKCSTCGKTRKHYIHQPPEEGW